VQGELEPVYRAALSLGVANQLTNILRDVGEDIRDRNRIYVPLDTLQEFGIQEADVLGGMHSTSTGKIDDRWMHFMQYMVRVPCAQRRSGGTSAAEAMRKCTLKRSCWNFYW
jgi:15-cis-phytoene synthase